MGKPVLLWLILAAVVWMLMGTIFTPFPPIWTVLFLAACLVTGKTLSEF